jgi:FtsP/CotA-like multicopper oxidase with cupredoxin domain
MRQIYERPLLPVLPMPATPRLPVTHRAVRAAVFACVAGLAGAAIAQPSLMPPGWDANMKLPETVDTNPDPKIVEIAIEAKLAVVEVSPGKTVEAWTYNGGIPGPTIRVNVGDRLIVHFTNSLPMSTTIHWHGLRVPIEMDGVPGYSQSDVPTDGTFTYDYIVPDAGLYWYHPHVQSAMQVGYGLYGAILVEDPDDVVSGMDEVLIVLSDIGIDEDGALEDPNSGGSTGMAFGREGNVILVNGRADRTLTARAGVPQRWRIANMAKSRYFALDLDGQTFTVIGGDGGLQEYATETTDLVVGAGERADVIVVPTGAPGSELTFRSYVFNRGFGSVEYRPAEELLFTLTFTDEPAFVAPPLPEVKRTIQPISVAGAPEIDMRLTITQDAKGAFIYGINDIPFSDAEPFLSGQGDTQIWALINESPWSHPWHLHGYFFQVLDDDGVPARPIVWKDTVDVPFMETVKVVVRFEKGRPGKWLMHCHILDHAQGGLMGTIQVGTPPPDHPTTTEHMQH